jgi:hemerythrin-like domain-containing protein
MSTGALIQLGRRHPSNGSVVELLRDCHARIRGFTALAIRLAQAAATPAERADAAERLHRYFAIALPLHVADEELSLRPRLEPTASAELRDALGEMTSEHAQSDALLANLLPSWDSQRGGLSHSPTTLAAARAFDDLMERHLAREERIVFPAVERLPPDAQREVVAEMRARRSR